MLVVDFHPLICVQSCFMRLQCPRQIGKLTMNFQEFHCRHWQNMLFDAFSFIYHKETHMNICETVNGCPIVEWGGKKHTHTLLEPILLDEKNETVLERIEISVIEHAPYASRYTMKIIYLIFAF